MLWNLLIGNERATLNLIKHIQFRSQNNTLRWILFTTLRPVQCKGHFFIVPFSFSRVKLGCCGWDERTPNDHTEQTKSIAKKTTTYRWPISCAMVCPMLGPLSSITAHFKSVLQAPLVLAKPIVSDRPLCRMLTLKWISIVWEHWPDSPE